MTRKFPAGRRSRTPSAERTSALEAVTRLMEERAKYEQWLEELEAKQDSTPPKVFDRVRHDYLARLQTVMDQLKEHTALLQENAANLVAKLRELEANEQEITDELAEAELRAQVGEITDAEWEATKRKAQREVAKLKENQEVIADDLIRIRDILSDGDDEGDEDDAPRTSADFDELEFLKSVVGQGTPTSSPKVNPVAPNQRPATPPGSAAQASGKPSDGMMVTAPRRTPAGGAQRNTPSAGARTAPAAAKPTASPAQGTPKVPAAEKAAAPPAPPERPDNALGVNASDVPEQPKTLKCAECGTMNYPSEWYCERCGAELAQI